MQISANWLKQWVDHGLTNEQLAERLTMAGLEVGRVIENRRCDNNVVVGLVRRVRAHSERKDLTVCEIDIGDMSALQVVCGAANVAAGVKSAVALCGAAIGDDARIETTLVHGVESNGMLCSESELGIGEDSEGIVIFDADAPVGTPVSEYLQLEDTLFDIELTPNRGDCLSMAGVARDVAILSCQPISVEAPDPVAATSERTMALDIEVPKDCPRYAGRVIERIRNDIKTPDWMKQRLHRTGLRCIHPIVDITNYVMVELGQPMHAFDLDKLPGSMIKVRSSGSGERLKLLDGSELVLKEGSLLIADESRPIALAGVMGGESSAIGSETTSVFLESAFFAPMAVRLSVSCYGLHTDASHRFERGVDPFLQVRAIERATDLIVSIAGGKPGPVQNVVNDEHVLGKQACVVRESRVEQVLGISLASEEIEAILTRVNEKVETVEGGWKVLPWPYRFDLEAEHDQVEEIARIKGYDSIPSTFRVGASHVAGGATREKFLSDSVVRQALEQAGYFEAITYSFVDPELQARICPSLEAKALSNPISSTMSVMRSRLWPGLFEALAENLRRQQSQVKLYEIGAVFLPQGEQKVLGGIVCGSYAPDQWNKQDRAIDFFDMKGDIERLYDIAGKLDKVRFRPVSDFALVPGCSAGIFVGDEQVGLAGQLLPEILSSVGVKGSAFVFELSMRSIAERSISSYSAISRFPAIMRDLSLMVEKTVAVDRVSEMIHAAAGDALESALLFDLYSGTGIDSNKKSVAFRLKFRVKSRTLTDSEVDSQVASIVKYLHENVGAQLRG